MHMMNHVISHMTSRVISISLVPEGGPVCVSLTNWPVCQFHEKNAEQFPTGKEKEKRECATQREP